jgi:hypothetical protein
VTATLTQPALLCRTLTSSIEPIRNATATDMAVIEMLS